MAVAAHFVIMYKLIYKIKIINYKINLAKCFTVHHFENK